jgi:type IV secretory pathway VirB4 component
MLEKLKNIFSPSKNSSKGGPLRLVTQQDLVAPPSVEVTPQHIIMEERYLKSFFVFSYPRYLSVGWLSPIINLPRPLDISFFFHPIDTAPILKQLRKKTTEIQAEIMDREEKGLVRSPELETAFQDIEQLRTQLKTAQERMFQVGIYFTFYGHKPEDLKNTETDIRAVLESRLIYIKPAAFQQKEGFITNSPYGLDQLWVHTLMNTSPLSSIFPFVSFDLSSNKGILYGINKHNNSLILFDRFSLENANEVIFGKSGGGKSYFAKLEIIRYLMEGVDVIIVDPENEYKFLSEAVGGSYFKISLSSSNHLNPFDLPTPRADEEPASVLRNNVLELVGLFKLMLGGLTPEEDSIVDQALTETYAAKDITPESDFSQIQPPRMRDFEAVLESMEGADSLVRRLRKYTQGSYANFFDQYSNVDMNDKLVTFGIRDMEDELRPMAMYVILHYIWNEIRSSLSKRIAVIDEAWWIMKTEEGASFLFSMAKRARKYWLGLTTITQDVSDFMNSAYGRPIINNSSLQLLMKQSPASIDLIQDTFSLTQGERDLLLSTQVGEGIFFAGIKRVAIQVVASYAEDQIITTSPSEVLKIKKAKSALKTKQHGANRF